MTEAGRLTISAVCSHHKYTAMWNVNISLTTLTQHEIPALIPWIHGGQRKLYRGFQALSCNFNSTSAPLSFGYSAKVPLADEFRETPSSLQGDAYECTK
jgi:hypothetical protein